MSICRAWLIAPGAQLSDCVGSTFPELCANANSGAPFSRQKHKAPAAEDVRVLNSDGWNSAARQSWDIGHLPLTQFVGRFAHTLVPRIVTMVSCRRLLRSEEAHTYRTKF